MAAESSTLKKRMAPAIPAFKHAYQQSITRWKVKWPLNFISSYSLQSIINVQKLLRLNLVITESAGEKSEGSHNVHPNNQSRNEKRGGYYASFVAMLHLLHSVTDK